MRVTIWFLATTGRGADYPWCNDWHWLLFRGRDIDAISILIWRYIKWNGMWCDCWLVAVCGVFLSDWRGSWIALWRWAWSDSMVIADHWWSICVWSVWSTQFTVHWCVLDTDISSEVEITWCLSRSRSFVVGLTITSGSIITTSIVSDRKRSSRNRVGPFSLDTDWISLPISRAVTWCDTVSHRSRSSSPFALHRIASNRVAAHSIPFLLRLPSPTPLQIKVLLPFPMDIALI